MKQIMGQDDISRVNCARVLELIRSHNGITRRQLEAETGLSWGGISNTVNRLIAAGYIAENKTAAVKGSGRNPGILEIVSHDNLTLGVDVNDTGLTACLIDLKNEVIDEFEAEANFTSSDALLKCLINFIEGTLTLKRNKRILSIGISMQGEVDGVNGVSVRLPQCPGWSDVPLKSILEERFSLPVLIGHDPDCMLFTFLRSEAHENTLLLRLDRSVGMAAALRGKILYGSGLWEAAHMTVNSAGPLCRCGTRGCLDAYIAACGVGKKVREDAIREIAEPLAAAARNLVYLFRPETLILCGDLMKYQDLFIERFTGSFQQYEICRTIRIVTVADAKAAMKGAAMLAAKQAMAHLDI